MARIDLSIVDRGTSSTSWTKEDVALTAEHLDDVMEQKTDNSGALNSLPTPFARFFVAREAFRRTKEEHINSKKEAGFAYKQMVSDILDVYEMLFNLTYHKNNTWRNGEKLELREWSKKDNLEYIKKKMPILYNSINEYYKSDIIEEKLYFLIFTEDGKEKLLACSSPITGFVTPPDMDKAMIKKDGSSRIKFAGSQYDSLHIRRKSKGEYFRDILMFEHRDPDFKNYMYNVLFGSDEINERFKAVKDYIFSFQHDPEIRNDYMLKLTDVKTDQNDNLVINGLALKSSDEVDIMSFFTDTLIRVPYRISGENFAAMKFQNDSKERDYDYLLPFKPGVMSLFDGTEISSDSHIGKNSVKVFLHYDGKDYMKEYSKDPILGQGRIVDLQAGSISFDLGIFPNILSHKEQENNYFKILVVGADEDPEAPIFNIDEISLSFFKKNGTDLIPIKEVLPEHEAQYGVEPAVVRSQQKSDEEESGTKFYELFNTSFNFIEVKILDDTGLLIPIWQQSKATNVTFTYAIDLGTSNTFISRCKNESDGKPDLSKKPELFKMDRPMVSFMHEVPEDKQYSYTRRIEDSIFPKAKNKIKTEFVPALIDGTDYKFPIRTALCGIHDKSKEPKLFDNHNIAFFYEKIMANDDQDVMTDIKWDKDEDMLRVFVRELLLIIKCDILQRDGDLDRTHLVWFSPLSFMGQTREIYQRIWNSEPTNILFIPNTQIRRFSESEAPYYYYKKMDYIADSDAVTVIDIGGGSTDFVYFKDNMPQMANSVHFGCDVLWENGFNDFANVKENGIYLKYADNLRFNRQDLEDLNECFKHVDAMKTKDIINFWLTNEKHCQITRFLSNDFKPVFIYHLTSILFYMASMYKENELAAPRTIVFSGNGSKYIDSFISSEQSALKNIIDMVFKHVFGGNHDVNIKLPEERKESTCYGGLYRDPNAAAVRDIVYQGDKSKGYEKVGDINANFEDLKSALMEKYKDLATLYKEVLNMLKQQSIIDSMANTAKYVSAAEEDMGTPLSTYYKKQVKEKYADEVPYKDSVFFLPVINKIFNMTKI
ncbi:MAG: hypothetical protein J6P55_07855 [Bacteroidaceae bacterium]|nr:hypothetical protein [Bacteroidaceae bacterium]